MSGDWIPVLESLRYDITRRDPLSAHKEIHSGFVVDVLLDESGQMRMTITRQIGGTKSDKRKSRAGREYQVVVEQNAVTLINYRLAPGDDLRTVLTEMETEIAGGAAQKKISSRQDAKAQSKN
jgi:hypothetical protein